MLQASRQLLNHQTRIGLGAGRQLAGEAGTVPGTEPPLLFECPKFYGESVRNGNVRNWRVRVQLSQSIPLPWKKEVKLASQELPFLFDPKGSLSILSLPSHRLLECPLSPCQALGLQDQGPAPRSVEIPPLCKLAGLSAGGGGW